MQRQGVLATAMAAAVSCNPQTKPEPSSSGAAAATASGGANKAQVQPRKRPRARAALSAPANTTLGFGPSHRPLYLPCPYLPFLVLLYSRKLICVLFHLPSFVIIFSLLSFSWPFA